MADIIIKGKIGMEDMEIQSNTNDPELFQRLSSVGGTMNLTKMPDLVHGRGRINVAEINVGELTAGQIFIGGSPAAVIPDDVTGFSVVQSGSHLIFTWNAVTDTDVDDYEIREGASWAAGTEIVSRAYGLTFTLFDFTSGAKTYRIKAINRSGVESVNDASYAITVVGTDEGTTSSSLTATPTFKYIVLEFPNVVNPNVQYTEVYSSDTNNRASASLIGTSYDSIYWDLVGTTGTTKYYWIRAKNLNGDYGAWTPTSPNAGVTATTAQLSTGDYEDLSITNAKIANLAVDTGKIALLAVQSAQIDNLTVATKNAAYYMASRGVNYYNAATVTLSDTTETEIGTLTCVTFEATDSIWFWTSAEITLPALITSGKGLTYDVIPMHFRVRRDSISGTIVSTGEATGPSYGNKEFYPPVILLGSDIPGGSAGNHVYKFTVQLTLTPDIGQGQVSYREFMAFAKSR